jgi:hypothetical protein
MLAWLRDPGYLECVDALFDVSEAQSTPRVAQRYLVKLDDAAVIEAASRPPRPWRR